MEPTQKKLVIVELSESEYKELTRLKLKKGYKWKTLLLNNLNK